MLHYCFACLNKRRPVLTCVCEWVGVVGDGEGGGYTIRWVFNHSTWFKWVVGWWAMATANGECVSPACVRLWCVRACVRACARACVCMSGGGRVGKL